MCFLRYLTDEDLLRATNQVSKSGFYGFFYHHHKISDPQSIIMSYIENLGLKPHWGLAYDHESSTQNIPVAETF
jgi:hypothetical protein